MDHFVTFTQPIRLEFFMAAGAGGFGAGFEAGFGACFWG